MKATTGIVLLVLLLAGSTRAIALDIGIQGLTPELKKNVLLHIGDIKAVELEQPARLARILKLATERALQPFGYYHPVISSSVVENGVQLQIDPGPRMIIAGLDIELVGEARSEAAFTALIRSSNLKPGSPLLHADYDALREDLLDLCRDMGYFDATYSAAFLYVNPAENSARPVLKLDSGRRYHFGELVVEGSDVAPQLLVSTAEFRTGEVFAAAKVVQFERNLRDTNYFSEVLVQTRRRDDAIVDIVALVEDVDTNRFEIGAGFSTDTGFRIRLDHLNPRLNGAGHSIETNTRVAQKEQTLDSKYRIPIANPLNDFYQVSGGFQNLEVEDISSSKLSTGLRRFRQAGQQWNWSYGISTEYEHYTVGSEPEKKVFYVMPGTSLTQTRLEPGFDPRSGHHYWANIDFSTPELGADTGFMRLRTSTKWLFGLPNDNTTVLTRLDLGAVVTSDLDSVPASIRFYTGGDRSIRGYDFASLSPRDENGALLGGKYLAVASVELSHRVLPRWRVAAFVDAGNAFDDASEGVYRGAGLGVRWLSPVGQISLDLAHPVLESEFSGLKVHISMGPPL